MKTLKELVSNILGIDKEEINDNSSPDNINSWDSFNTLMLVSEIEKNFNVKFNMDEVMSIKNINDIKKLLGKHGVTKGIND
ncbi:MAG: acyl carrier protein [Nanoarchaeota archaeon]|nr:acyl carrier protein [Nanoarchaeota archaeon]